MLLDLVLALSSGDGCRYSLYIIAFANCFLKAMKSCGVLVSPFSHHTKKKDRKALYYVLTSITPRIKANTLNSHL